MKVFRLYVRTDNRWEMACSVLAENAEKALGEAKAMLKPEHQNKPHRLVAQGDPPPKDE